MDVHTVLVLSADLADRDLKLLAQLPPETNIAVGNSVEAFERPVHSEPSSFGPLACVRDDDGTWCLTQDGRLVNWTGLGFVGYSWTKASLVSEQPTAPATDFTLSGVPRGPWLVPPG